MKTAYTMLLVSFLIIVSLSGVVTTAEAMSPDWINTEIVDRGLNWTAGVTSVSNLSIEEKSALCGLRVDSKIRSSYTTIQAPAGLNVGSEIPYGTFDWRNVNGGDWMTPIRNQESCGSCWAFADLGVLEAIINIELDDPDLDVDLSEQHLLSCSSAGDCVQGGSPAEAFLYIQEDGVPVEECFLYTATDSPCTPCTDWKDTAWRVGDIYQIVPGTTAAYKWGLEKYGPMVVALDAPDDIFYYTGGIYEPLDGWSGTPNHAVVLVGYNDTGGYWIIKNSWGESWGNNGYGKVYYGDLEQYSSYGFPLVVDNVSGPTPVLNLNTSKDFYTIQAAIDDPDTLNGHIIEVEYGIYYENVVVNKALTIRSANGAGRCVISARDPDKHVFEVTSDYVNISGFTVEGTVSGAGIVLEGADYCGIVDTVVTDNEYGIYLNRSSMSRLHDNIIVNNTYNLGISGNSLDEFIHDVDITNTVNGKPVYLIKNQSDLIIDSSWNAGFLGVVNAENITVQDITISDNIEGILFANTKNSTIANVTILDNEEGIYLQESSNNTITGSTITSNTKRGICLISSSNNKIFHNKFINNTAQGYDNMNTNTWDNGYPSGGNYWSDYLCVDDNGDGIGDVAYTIAGGAGAEDWYPLCFILSCKGDFNDDSVINFDDFMEFAAAYGSSTGDPNYNVHGDFNDDGVINFDDFMEFAAVYGTSCP